MMKLEFHPPMRLAEFLRIFQAFEEEDHSRHATRLEKSSQKRGRSPQGDPSSLMDNSPKNGLWYPLVMSK